MATPLSKMLYKRIIYLLPFFFSPTLKNLSRVLREVGVQ